MGFGVGERREDWCIVVVEITLSIERYSQHTYPRWHAGARWGEEVVGEEVIDIVADAPPRRHLPGLFCLRGCWGCWVGVWVSYAKREGAIAWTMDTRIYNKNKVCVRSRTWKCLLRSWRCWRCQASGFPYPSDMISLFHVS